MSRASTAATATQIREVAHDLQDLIQQLSLPQATVRSLSADVQHMAEARISPNPRRAVTVSPRKVRSPVSSPSRDAGRSPTRSSKKSPLREAPPTASAPAAAVPNSVAAATTTPVQSATPGVPLESLLPSPADSSPQGMAAAQVIVQALVDRLQTLSSAYRQKEVEIERLRAENQQLREQLISPPQMLDRYDFDPKEDGAAKSPETRKHPPSSAAVVAAPLQQQQMQQLLQLYTEVQRMQREPTNVAKEPSGSAGQQMWPPWNGNTAQPRAQSMAFRAPSAATSRSSPMGLRSRPSSARRSNNSTPTGTSNRASARSPQGNVTPRYYSHTALSRSRSRSPGRPGHRSPPVSARAALHSASSPQPEWRKQIQQMWDLRNTIHGMLAEDVQRQ